MTASTALVTGASGGIGLHIARQFAEQGGTVLVGARDEARGAEAAAQFGGHPLLLDVTDADTIARAAATVPELDVLVKNAGISLDTGTPVTETDVEIFRRTYETNLFGVLAVTNASLPALRPLGASADRQCVQRYRIADLEHRPQSAVRLPGGWHGIGRRLLLLEAALDALTVFYAQALAHEGFKVS
jgi:NAD(P)-dependent dehydrogenase (short-subunit alcohol dehydrogenase family)